MHKEGGVYLFYLDVSTRPAPGVPLSRSARPHRSAALIPEHNAAAPFLKCLAPTYRNFKARGKKPAPFRKYGAEKILISTIVCIYLFLTMINEKNAKKKPQPPSQGALQNYLSLDRRGTPRKRDHTRLPLAPRVIGRNVRQDSRESLTHPGLPFSAENRSPKIFYYGG